MQFSPKNTIPEPIRDTEAILEVFVVMLHVVLFQVGVVCRKAATLVNFFGPSRRTWESKILTFGDGESSASGHSIRIQRLRRKRQLLP